MSESEEFESFKVTELQNELKKRGLDTKGRKADLITRLRQAINNGIEAGDTPTDEESAPAVLKDETSSPSSAIDDDDEEDQPPPVADEPENVPVESPSSKKRSITDEEEGEDNENEKIPSEDVDNEELAKQPRKKKSRWGSEQEEDDDGGEESPEKQTTNKRVSDEEDNVDNSSTTSSSRHRDHHRSSRQDDDRLHSSRRSERSPEKELPLPEEETVQFNPEDVVLDFYTSDLNLTVKPDCLSASSKSNDALCFLWAGIRATYGFKQGKICYEIRITEIIDSPHLPESEKEKFGIRVGWSNSSSSLQLGECNNSFAYTSSGKKISQINDQFSEETYGEPFGQADILACYIDFGDDENENIIRMSFTKNGEDYGQAFEIDKTTIDDPNRLIFSPHILVKNVQFECNFGQLENPWSETKSGYLFPQNIPLNDRIRSSEPILEKSDCQVLLLSGLNGSGKTTWAKKYIEENPTKHFQLINAESVLNQMTVDGKVPSVKDRNDGVMLRVNICLQKLIEIAAQRRRNFIIDHMNTTREIQGKRQRLFTGYNRIGVVIVPDDDELRARIEKIEKGENISIPSQWIREAKGRFHFLQKSSTLEDVIYPELSYEDARSLYDKARRDYDQHRSSSSSSSRYERHDDYRSSRHERNRHDERDRGSRDRDRHDRYDRSRSRERGSRDRDHRTSRDDSRYSSSSSRRNDNYGSSSSGGHNNYRGGGYSRGGGGSGSGGGGYSDYRQDSRNNNYHQRGGGFQGRGGNSYNNNQSSDGWRGGFQQQQRNDYGGGGGGRGRGDFRGGNQFNNRGSYQDNQRGGGGFRGDFNNQPRGRQFNDYEKNSQRPGTNREYVQNNNNFNQQNDRQGFGGPRMNAFQNQQQQPQPRPQALLQTPPSTQQFPPQQQVATNPNPNLALQAQNPLGLNPTGVAQPTSLDSWFALYAAALTPQATQQQQQLQQQPQQQQQQVQPQQDANSITQQWSQWLKTAQMGQAAQQQQQQAQLTVQQSDAQQTQLSDATALYYQAYYAQLAAAQKQAAAGANGSGGGVPGSTEKS